MTLVLGEINVARMNPYRLTRIPPVLLGSLGLVRASTVSGGHPMTGGDTRPATYLMDDVHQARITSGIGDGDDVGRG